MKYYYSLITIILLSCVQDDEFSIPELVCNDPNLTQTISAQQVYEASRNDAKLYTEEDVLTGYVVTSDEGGNKYKNISFLDSAGKGFNISVDRYDNYTAFEPGRKVYVKLNGLYTQ